MVCGWRVTRPTERQRCIGRAVRDSFAREKLPAHASNAVSDVACLGRRVCDSARGATTYGVGLGGGAGVVFVVDAEAYWSWAGDQLILQARPPGAACDRIFRMPLHLAPPPLSATPPVPVSSGRGATTCSYFLPGDREVIFASTEGGDAACPPRPDHSKGYVWALHPTYDIYRANADGSAARRLTSTPGAEGTVCARDGSIVFTSVRDGDIDLYRMDADGGNVRRLTTEVGYDGGAFFNADCTRIVWRASRPRPGPELDDYRHLLAQNLVRPSKLELYVANADGSDPMQVTYLDAASFGPAWQPDGKRLIFASNHGAPRGREFDLWARRRRARTTPTSSSPSGRPPPSFPPSS